MAKVKAKVVNSKTIAWKQNFYNVFKGIKNLNFWGVEKKSFLLHIPNDVDSQIDRQLSLIFKNFKDLDPSGRELTKRKYIILHAMNSMGLLMEETTREVNGKETKGIHQMNERDMMETFIGEYWKTLEEEFGYEKDKSRTKK